MQSNRYAIIFGQHIGLLCVV